MSRERVAPLFLLASERSGTNLFRRRLWSAQSSICAPPPIHLLQTLFYAQPFYGDLADDPSFRILIDDALGLCYQHFSPWDEEIQTAEVLAAYDDVFGERRNLVGVMHVIYSIYAQRKGCRGYFCKDNDMFDYFHVVRQSLPNSRFVYMHRDPRDFVLSQRKRPHQTSSVVRLAELWRDEQQKCLTDLYMVRDDAITVTLSYEELIADETGTMQRVCSELELEYRAQPPAEIPEESTDIFEWRNLNRPTLTDNMEKYRQELSRREIAVVESITWHTMKLLGYRPVSQSRPVVRRTYKEYDKQKHWFMDAVKRPLQRRLHMTQGQRARSQYLKSLKAKFL